MMKYINGMIAGFIATLVLSALMVMKSAIGLMPQLNGVIKAVAFDAVGTLFSLGSLRHRLKSAGLASHHLETWLASFPHDAFAMEISGEYKPFRDIASANLSVLLEKELGRADPRAVDHVLEAQ